MDPINKTNRRQTLSAPIRNQKKGRTKARSVIVTGTQKNKNENIREENKIDKPLKERKGDFKKAIQQQPRENVTNTRKNLKIPSYTPQERNLTSAQRREQKIKKLKKKLKAYASLGITTRLEKKQEKEKQIKAVIKRLKDAETSDNKRELRNLEAYKYFKSVYKESEKGKETFVKQTRDTINSSNEILDTFAKIGHNIMTVVRTISPHFGSSTSNVSVAAGSTVSATVDAAALTTDALGIGVGAIFIPLKILDSITSVRKNMRISRMHAYAKQYIKENGTQDNRITAAAHCLKNQHRIWDARFEALDSIQSLTATCVATGCAVAAAVSATTPAGAIVVPVVTTTGVSVAIISLSTTIGLKTFKTGKKIFKWTQKQAYKNALEKYPNAKKPLAKWLTKRANASAIRAFKKERGIKKLPRETREHFKQEIEKKAKEKLTESLIKRSHSFMAKEFCSQIRMEQTEYYNEKENPQLDETGPIYQFLVHFGVSSEVIKAVVDCENFDIATKVLKATLKESIKELDNKGVIS